MNYLAHLFLAGDSAESMIGNLAGDFVKGVLHDRFPPAITAGIVMHRKIDAFTDSHPQV
ncbi:MAG: ACP phosphodiesterase, partial [Thermoanaerobaculia bacterium]